MTAKISPPQRAKRNGGVRLAIVEAALALFSQRHADGVAIDDIVGAAGVAKGSFYNHFSDKDDLVITLLNEIRDRIETEVVKVNAGIDNYAVRICRAICIYIGFFYKNPIEGAFLLRNGQAVTEIIFEDVNRGLRADVKAGLSSGELNVPTVDAGTLFIMGVSYAALQAATQGGDKDAMTFRVQQVCKLMLRGLGLGESKAELFSSQAVDDVLHP